ncbi:MFS general substrate transporter [Dentipellis sp. KUC8613]|nr:MFS general substrate transporter [Dentipellis sp. KUC8613]
MVGHPIKHGRAQRYVGTVLCKFLQLFEIPAKYSIGHSTPLRSIMQSPKILSTVFQIPSKLRFSKRPSRSPQNIDDAASSVTQIEDPELMLPKMSSLVVMIALNALSQVSFFIIVSSSSKYAEYLGGSATFSGLVIGIPVVFAGLALIPLMRLDKGAYSMPLHFACANAILGHIFYGLAYRAHFLYLILIGRIVVGFAFTNFMYSKRFCSDPRLVGIRRRTTLAGWLVVGQGVGFSVGPFVGGLLYKVGFGNEVFNGYTSPGWVMAICWLLFWIIFPHMFQDVPKVRRPPVDSATELEAIPFPQATRTVTADLPVPDGDTEAKGGASASVHALPDDDAAGTGRLSARQWGVCATMCWFAMTSFFVLGAWEANIPVYTAQVFGWSPFAAGNFIALGGIATFPLLFLNVLIARRTQDRYILALGCGVGGAGLLITLAICATNTVHFGSLFVCWFLTALRFNVISTVTMSLLSKRLPGSWNGKTSLAIQYSNFSGRVSGAVWGGSGLKVGMLNCLGLQIGILGVGVVLTIALWRDLKAKTG